MENFDKSRWKPNRRLKKHDGLLLEYCQKHGGTTFAGAKLKGDPFPYPRQIDGIRFPSRTHGLISRGRCDPGEFEKEFEKHLTHARQDRLPVEVIEVTPNLGRYVVGQVVVGGWLLKEEYKVKVAEVLVCPEASQGLKAFFRKHNILLWTPN